MITITYHMQIYRNSFEYYAQNKFNIFKVLRKNTLCETD